MRRQGHVTNDWLGRCGPVNVYTWRCIRTLLGVRCQEWIWDVTVTRWASIACYVWGASDRRGVPFPWVAGHVMTSQVKRGSVYQHVRSSSRKAHLFCTLSKQLTAWKPYWSWVSNFLFTLTRGSCLLSFYCIYLYALRIISLGWAFACCWPGVE